MPPSLCQSKESSASCEKKLISKPFSAIVENIMAMEGRARARVRFQANEDEEIFLDANLKDLSHTRGMQTLFTQTSTFF
jgi:hypothetical protein